MARSRHVKKIDNVRWVRTNGSALVLSAGTIGVVYILVTTLPETLMRIRGEAFVRIDAAGGPGRLVLATMGIIKVPEGTGATVLYDPQSDGDAPWVWHYQTFVGYEEAVTDVVDYGGAVSRIVIDNKAMRRTRPDEEYQFVVTNTTIAGSSAIDVAFATRNLVGF